MSHNCAICEKSLSTIELKRYVDPICSECHQIVIIREIALELREARITFEEMIRKIIIEVDR